MLDASEKRFPNANPMIPPRIGIVDDVDKFDATFFGVPLKQSNLMDPQCRLLMETAYEAILDAGVCPRSIHGSRTGVFIGVTASDTDGELLFGDIDDNNNGLTGFVPAHFLLSSHQLVTLRKIDRKK